MTPSAYMALATLLLLGLLTALAWLVAKLSPRWGDRIAQFALITLVTGALTTLMMWVKE
jgi:hypothetical protein